MRLGVYYYHVLRRGSFPAQFDGFKMPVKILNESQSQFQIEFVHPHKDGRTESRYSYLGKEKARKNYEGRTKGGYFHRKASV